jgi:hypothetical protein
MFAPRVMCRRAHQNSLDVVLRRLHGRILVCGRLPDRPCNFVGEVFRGTLKCQRWVRYRPPLLELPVRIRGRWVRIASELALRGSARQGVIGLS